MANRLDAKEVVTETENISAPETLQVEAHDNFESLRGIQQEWDDCAQSAGSEIFLTYDWCRVWWDYYGKGRDLRIYLFRRDGALVGILPLFFERIRLGLVSVRAGKIVGSDYTPAQFSPPMYHDHIRDVLRRFYELSAKDKWDILHFGPIAGLYEHYEDLRKACEELFGGSHRVTGKDGNVQTYFMLPETWDEHLAGLNRKERTKIRRHYRLARRAAGDGANTVAADYVTTDNLGEMFADFVQMHQRHWQNLKKLGHFGDWPCAHEFHRELAGAQLKRDRLCLTKITLGDWCLGYKYGYVFGDHFCDFLDARSGRDEVAQVGLGRIIHSEMIRTAIQRKAKSIDSMRG
ncbi:MAG: GNAT family N-acetyltransferase, partial [Planctomycetota bacterium]